MIIFPLSNSKKLASEIAHSANDYLGKINIGYFPDGELHLQFEGDLRGKKVVLVQTMHPNPNSALLELLFAAKTAKDLHAAKVVGVIPYLGYMRQDKRFHQGECVSNAIVAGMLNSCLDKIITVDPHLHRVHNLADLFHIERKKLSANNAIGNYISRNFSAKNSIIVGPDNESSQWAKSIAETIGFEYAIFSKERFSSHRVKINVITEHKWSGKNVVVVDDIISSGHTMIEAIKEIKKRKPKTVHVICVHGIFAEKSFEKLKKLGAKTIISTDSVSHSSNRIHLSGVIANEL